MSARDDGIGLVQALLCNKNTCPTGITTQISTRNGLVVSDKKVRANYHQRQLTHLWNVRAAGIETQEI